MKTKLQKNARLRLLSAGFLLLSAQFILAQQTISGKVSDAADGLGMPGVNVVVKGSTIGAITDLDGNYSIDVAGPGAVLHYSYVGYLSQEIPVGSQTEINVELQEDIRALEEVVVIGYGTVKKQDLTGSVAVVSAKELAKTPSANLSQALQGRASGVMVTQSGKPGSGVTIRIRGIGSINQNPNPLYVIDGVVGGSINDISPNDVESFQVLKDASAAAIYGADGANGVVIVTTRRGKEGKPKLSFSAYGSMNLAPKPFDMMNATQYSKFYNQIYDDNGIERDEAYSDEFRQFYYGQGWEEGTNWQSEILQKAYTQNYYLRISGGGKASNYSVSANVLDEDGILLSTGASRYNLRANSDFKIGQYIKVGESFTVSRNIRFDESAYQGSVWRSSLIASPLMTLYNENNKGGYSGPQEAIEYTTAAGDVVFYNNTGGNDKANPVVAQALAKNQSNYNSFVGNVYIEIKPLSWLSFKSTPSVIGSFSHTRNWMPRFESGVRSNSPASLTELFTESMNLSLENQLMIMKSFGEHTLTITGVQHARKYDGYSSSVTASDFAYEKLNTLQNATSIDNVTGYITPVRWNSYLVRAIYDYKSRYLLTASIRRDGNSRFGPGNRWGTFPSASLAWKLNEDLLPDVEQIDMLKLRMGYGKTGFSEIGNFAYEANLSAYSQFSPVFGTSQSLNPALNVLDSFGNELIQWESSAMTNIGVDVSLYRNKLTASLEYYIKNTDNLIVDRSVSRIFARITEPKVNLGDLRNRGLEFNVSYREMEGDVNYEISGMLTTIKNEVLDIPETYIDGNNIARVGNTVGSLYGYIAERIVTPEDFDTDGNYLFAIPAEGIPSPGDLKFTDLNLDGEITDEDRTIIGKPIPDLIYSINVNLYYKNFDLGMYWYGSRNVDVYNSQRASVECFASQDLDHNKTVGFAENYYRSDRPSAEYVRADINNTNLNDRISTWWVEDASFLRMKDVQLGYTLPKHLAQRIGMSGARLYLSGVNLLTITKYKGPDPESATTGPPMRVGTDWGTYPMPRIITAGVQIDF